MTGSYWHSAHHDREVEDPTFRAMSFIAWPSSDRRTRRRPTAYGGLWSDCFWDGTRYLPFPKTNGDREGQRVFDWMEFPEAHPLLKAAPDKARSEKIRMQIRQDDPTASHVAALLTHHLRELQGAMAGHAFALDATGLSAASVTFWTAWDGDALRGFGALKQLDDSRGEVKSMRVAPDARGSGVGRAMLHHIIGAARQRGYIRLSLETGTALLHAPAISLYRSAGFTSCDAFADHYPSAHNQFFQLDLPRTPF